MIFSANTGGVNEMGFDAVKCINGVRNKNGHCAEAYEAEVTCNGIQKLLGYC